MHDGSSFRITLLGGGRLFFGGGGEGSAIHSLPFIRGRHPHFANLGGGGVAYISPNNNYKKIEMVEIRHSRLFGGMGGGG